MKAEGRRDAAGASRTGDIFEGSLSMRGLKDLVLAQFPEGHPLREVILAEKDRLTPAEFLAKMPVWFVLLSCRA